MNRVSIANLALSNLGEAPIQNLTDDNARARIANSRIDDVIRGVLRMHDWNSAMKRVALVKIGEPLFGFNTTFQLPADFIKIIEVWPISRYRIQGDTVLSNEDTLSILYVAEPIDVNKLDVFLVAEIQKIRLQSIEKIQLFGMPSVDMLLLYIGHLIIQQQEVQY